MPGAGAGAPHRPLTADGALIPIGVDLRKDGAPEGVEFPGAGAPCAPQFRFGPLDCVGSSEAGDKFGDRGAERALQQARFLSCGKQVAIDLGHGPTHRLSDERLFIEHRNGMSTVVTEEEAGVLKGAPQRRSQASGVGEAVGQKTGQAVAGGGRS